MKVLAVSERLSNLTGRAGDFLMMSKALSLNYAETTRAAETYGQTPAAPQAAQFSRPLPALNGPAPFDAPEGTVVYDEWLAGIVVEALPVIRGIIRNKLRVSLNASDGSRENQDALEISCEIQVCLMTTLRKSQAAAGRAFIDDFQSYVAVIAFNACHDYLRRKHPRRHSLKNRLRYLLTRRPEFSAWEIGGAMFCGLTEWRFQKRAPAAPGRLRQLLDGSDPSAELSYAGGDAAAARSLPLAELVSAIFRGAGGPVELDDLVGVVAALQEVKEERFLTEDELYESGADLCETRPVSGANPALEAERRFSLRQLWSEICQLPPRQRAALLLNLRDAQGKGACVDLFPATNVASLREIASALGMTAEELSALWNELPLDDSAIAARLRVTRQQVINLRKSARERLSRRMKAVW
jgi:DNA-directed RNA polymerase specialized sigma24 family protein